MAVAVADADGSADGDARAEDEATDGGGAEDRDGAPVEPPLHAATTNATTRARVRRMIRTMGSSSRLFTEANQNQLCMECSSLVEPLPARWTDDQPVHDLQRR